MLNSGDEQRLGPIYPMPRIANLTVPLDKGSGISNVSTTANKTYHEVRTTQLAQPWP